jgi:hypothetical protein
MFYTILNYINVKGHTSLLELRHHQFLRIDIRISFFMLFMTK